MTQNHIKNIAIVGAGGQSGGYITQALVKAGKHTITALTRPDSTNKMPDGATVKKVDFNNHASIVSALQGIDCLITTLAVTAPPDTSAKLFKAAAEAQVLWIIPNEWGGDSTDMDHTQAIFWAAGVENRGIIDSLGVSSWIGVACSFWYEFSLGGGIDRYGFDIPNKKVVFYDQGETKIHTSTFPQVGRAVAALMALPIHSNNGGLSLESYRNKFAHISSFKVNQKEMFASLVRVTGSKESDWDISYEPVQERYQKALEKVKAGDRTAFGRLLYSRGFFNPSPLDFDKYGLDNDKFGLPKEDLDAFTKVGVDLANGDYFEKRYGGHKS